MWRGGSLDGACMVTIQRLMSSRAHTRHSLTLALTYSHCTHPLALTHLIGSIQSAFLGWSVYGDYPALKVLASSHPHSPSQSPSHSHPHHSLTPALARSHSHPHLPLHSSTNPHTHTLSHSPLHSPTRTHPPGWLHPKCVPRVGRVW